MPLLVPGVNQAEPKRVQEQADQLKEAGQKIGEKAIDFKGTTIEKQLTEIGERLVNESSVMLEKELHQKGEH